MLMSEKFVVGMENTPINAQYKDSSGVTIRVVQPASGDGYAVFKDSAVVYVTEDYDELTYWIMKDLGLVG